MTRSLALLCSLTLSVAAIGDPCPNVVFTLKQTLSDHSGAVEHLQTIDYDHDGKLDLVGTIRDGNNDANLYSWRGAGDGTFETAVALGETDLLDLQVINVNHDAYDDLVGANTSAQAWVRFGKAGGFDPAVFTSLSFYPYRIYAGDFHEGDSTADLLVSTFGAFALYRGNSDGTFTTVRSVTMDPNDWTMDNRVADFDNDGRMDVALAQRMSEQLHVYFRNVDGTFASPVTLPAGKWPATMEIADFDEDGFVDLAAANWDDGMINVFLNQGDRTFVRQTLTGKPPGQAWGELKSIQVVDINADSHADILAAAINGGWIATYLGDGNGAFSSAAWSAYEPLSPGNLSSIVTGNFDSDSDLELAGGDYPELFIYDHGCAPQVIAYPVNRVISSGQPSKLRAVVSGISANIPTPRGSVTFKEGATLLGAVDIDAAGFAALDYPGLAVGDHMITAVFSGNSVVSAATSAEVLQRVISTPSTISIGFAPSTHGEPFTNVVFIGSRNMFIDDYYRLTIDGVTESQRRYSGTPLQLTLSAGPHTIVAEYPGSFFDPPSVSPTYNITTAKHSVTLVKSGDTNVRQGTAHTIQVSVNVPTSPAPTGTITLYRQGTQITSAAVTNGVATITTTLPRGAYEYVAVYSGDVNYLTKTTPFTLNVMANQPLVIDARIAGTSISIPALVPDGTTATTMYRRVHGTATWSPVGSWSLGSPTDQGPFALGVLYDYRLDATVSGQLQQSNIDSSLIYTDANSLDPGIAPIKLAHFTELRDAINGLRTAASLPPFALAGTFGAGATIRAAHLSAMRTAVAEARAALGMIVPAWLDPTLDAVAIKRFHILQLREAAN